MTLADMLKEAPILSVEDRVTLIKTLVDSLTNSPPIEPPMDEDEQETPAQKLVRLIDEANLDWESPFAARDADEILRNEMGIMDYRDEQEARA